MTHGAEGLRNQSSLDPASNPTRGHGSPQHSEEGWRH